VAEDPPQDSKRSISSIPFSRCDHLLAPPLPGQRPFLKLWKFAAISVRCIASIVPHGRFNRVHLSRSHLSPVDHLFRQNAPVLCSVYLAVSANSVFRFDYESTRAIVSKGRLENIDKERKWSLVSVMLEKNVVWLPSSNMTGCYQSVTFLRNVVQNKFFLLVIFN